MSWPRSGGCWVSAAGLGLLVLVEFAAGRPSASNCEERRAPEVEKPTPPTSLSLHVGQTKAKIEFWQDGAIVPHEGSVLHLAPHPFSVRLYGDVDEVSYFAEPTPVVTEHLVALDRPLVLLAATSMAQFPHKMLHGYSLSFLDGETPVFDDAQRRQVEAITRKPPLPDELGAALHERYGQLPRVFGWSRGHFDGLVEQDLPRGTTELEVEIESIEGKLSDCTTLALFIEQSEPGYALEYIGAAAFQIVTLCFDGDSPNPGMLAMASRPSTTRR